MAMKWISRRQNDDNDDDDDVNDDDRGDNEVEKMMEINAENEQAITIEQKQLVFRDKENVLVNGVTNEFIWDGGKG